MKKGMVISVMVFLMLLIVGCAVRETEPPPVSTPTPTPAPKPTPTPTPENILGLHTTKATGEKKVIVVLVYFPDVKPMFSQQQIYRKVFVALDEYFREVSYGQMRLNGDITKRYVLPQPVSYYKISSRNLEVDPSRLRSLVKDALDAADSDVNFSQYSYVMIVLGATHREYGMIGLCAFPGMLGFKTRESAIATKSGQTISNAVVFCENAHLGTFVHDTLHMLGGLIGDKRVTPCLYDHDLQAKYPSGDDWPKCLIHMGFWDPLSSHAPYKRELPPAGLSSWTKMRLGWIDPSKVAMVSSGQTTSIRLDSLASATSSTLVIKIPLTSDTFYLIENRQKIGFDENVPSSGILILYADDTVSECRHGQAPVKLIDANPSVPYLEGAAFDIGKNELFKDNKNNLAIILLRKVDLSYEIQITTADRAGQSLGK